ncbi:MAG: NAD(P)-dependent oxidoreductase [Candidatus Omnitrophota bacterium]|jgi:nucleoside-diphosphate-sugar epimerase
MLKNKRILITGATGFIGSNLARYFLKKCARVDIFARKGSDKWRIRDILKDLSDHAVDLMDPGGIKRALKHAKPEIVIHTASYGGNTLQNDNAKIISTNLNATINLVDALKATRLELLINTSSSSEYGIRLTPMKESDPLEPVTLYGVSKAAASMYCSAMAKKENMPIVTARLFSPYGYYEEKNRLVPYLILSCLKAKDPGLTSSKNVRDFIFIEDVISAYEKMIYSKDKASGEIFNIASGKQHSVGDIVREVISLTGAKVRPGWKKMDNPRLEPKRWQADISKTYRILKWKPKYDLACGLEKDINWFKENIASYNRS